MLILRSPAKVNLFLRVLSKRNDGYHELASLFQAVSLFDTLHFTLAEHDYFTCTDPTLPIDRRNLVIKALELFRRKTGVMQSFDIFLNKQIPSEAGLGGGSSNAATTLWAVNELTGRPATLQQLKEWSGEIGSDITFFLSQGTAYCTGRGEIIEEKDVLSPVDLWIVKPAFGLPTPSVYKQLKLDDCQTSDPSKLLDGFLSGDPHYINDLESPAFKLLPDLGALKNRLAQQFPVVLLCGSGTSFFCIGSSSQPFVEGCSCYRASFVNRNPHHWY